MTARITRREIFGGFAAVAGGVTNLEPKPMIQTVLGAVSASKLGFALPHEHILCDFIGADKTGRERWIVDDVVKTALPHLQAIKQRGVESFFDCTPAFIGRDPRVLTRLAGATGLNIVTNTGYYGAANDKYLPKHAFTESAEQLAPRWIREWESGIDETGVRPGFIKIGVDPANPKLSDVDSKLVRAAAIASRKTGLTVASHTAQGAAALEEVAIFRESGGDLARFIIVHADVEPDPTMHRKMLESGAWVEYDGIGSRPIDDHVKLVKEALKIRPDRLLLSMDAGWYNAGEPNGGKFRSYIDLTDRLLPALRAAGVNESDVRRLTSENPAKAFAR